MPTRTIEINNFTGELRDATNSENTTLYGVENGVSVKLPVPKIREGLVTDNNLKTLKQEIERKDAEQDRRLDKLESDVTTNALQEVSNGIDGEFVETIIGEKNEGQQTIGVSVTIQPISTASEDNRGVAESSDVKNFVNDSLEEINNALEDIINGEINVNILTAGNGVNIANNVISADTTILATKKDIENIKPQQSEQVQSDWNESDLTSKSYIQNKPNLHAVAISGSYNDLKDKPTIGTDYVQYHASLDDADTSKPAVDASGHIFVKGDDILIRAYQLYGTIPSEEEQKNVHKVPQGDYYPDTDYYSGMAIWSYGWKDEIGNTLAIYGAPIDNIIIGSSMYFAENEEYLTLKSVDILAKTAVAIDSAGKEYNLINAKEWRGTNKNGVVVNKQSGARLHLNNSATYAIIEYDGHTDCEFYDMGVGGFRDYFTSSNTDIVIGGWKDVYDTSTISADISAEVQRATQAEQALSTRIDGKADASTWSASLKQQIDTDHTTLSGLSSKWTDILKSQIDADHTTLGTLNTYLSESKRTSIDNAISKAHTQNTDTMLASGKLNVESNKISASLPIVSSGDIQGADTSGTMHLLSKKMNSDMLRTYNSFADMVADKQQGNIPQGAWCAIIE